MRLAPELARLFPAGARVAVPAVVLAELDRLAARGVPNATAARQLAARWEPLPSPGRGDAAVLQAAIAHHAVVATSDQRLVDKVRAAGLCALVPRDRSRLELRLPSPTRRPPATVKARSSVDRRSSARV